MRDIQNFNDYRELPVGPCIYMWRNPRNSKIYIGKSVDMRGRLRSYRCDAKLRPGKAPILKAFKKNGIDIFQLKILEEYPNRTPYIEDLIIEREAFWIKILDSTIRLFQGLFLNGVPLFSIWACETICRSQAFSHHHVKEFRFRHQPVTAFFGG